MDWDSLPDSGNQAPSDVRNIVNPLVGGVQTLDQPPSAFTVVEFAPPGFRPAGSRRVDGKWPATCDR